MKVFYFLIIFIAVIFGVGFLFVSLSFEQELKLLKDVAFGAMYWFSTIFAIVGTAILIPRDVEDRTLYTILSKPVPRFEYLIGKLLGVLLLVGVSLLAMDLIFSGILYFRQSTLLSYAALNSDPEAASQMTEMIRAQGHSWDLQAVVFSIFLMASVLASVSMLLSTFATSTMFTIVMGFAVFMIGHGQALARNYFLQGETTGAVDRLITVGLAILFPDLQLFNLVDGVASGESIPFNLLLRITGIALLYVIIYNFIAYLIFSAKEL